MNPLPVVLVNLGTPASADPAAVKAFLAEFLSDQDVVDWPGWIWKPILRGIILRSRPSRVAELYKTIWTPEGSPLAAATNGIARELQKNLGDEFMVLTAYRYGTPSLTEVLQQADRVAGPDRKFPVIPLFPQRTCSTTGTIQKTLQALAPGLRSVPALTLIPPDDPDYIEALVARCREVLRRFDPLPEHLLISFHGIPARYDRREGGLYREDCRRTTQSLLRALGWPENGSTLAYQSKFGPEPWLKPSTAATILELPKRGIRRLLVTAPGFLTDGLETLEELGVRGKAAFRAEGGTGFALAPAPADHPGMIRCLARLAGPFSEPPTE